MVYLFHQPPAAEDAVYSENRCWCYCAATVESKLKVFHSFFACTQGSVGTGISDTIRCLFNIKRLRQLNLTRVILLYHILIVSLIAFMGCYKSANLLNRKFSESCQKTRDHAGFALFSVILGTLIALIVVQ